MHPGSWIAVLALGLGVGAAACDAVVPLGRNLSDDAGLPGDDDAGAVCDCSEEEAPVCPDDSRPPLTDCRRGPGGDCVATFASCPERLTCALEDCGPFPPTLPCDRVTPEVLVERCVPDGADGCTWDTEECPCPDEWCVGRTPTACADGLEPDFVCERQEKTGGECGWSSLGCPNPGEPCRGEDPCGELPPSLPCGDGALEELTGACVVDTLATGCVWETRSCDCPVVECGEGPPDADPCLTDPDGDGWWCERQPDDTCRWDTYPGC